MQDISADKILELEFNYIKDTANQAIDDRYKLLNFYIAIATFVATIAIGAFTVSDIGKVINLQAALAALCLLISFIGWIFLAMLIRLRQAWHGSMQAMNQIKTFYADNAGVSNLCDAFLWKQTNIPQRHQFWNIHFYSALLIVIIDSAFLAAGLVIVTSSLPLTFIAAIISVALQVYFYRYSLYRNV